MEHASVTVLTRYTLLVDTLAGTDDLYIIDRAGDDGCGAAAALVSITVFVKLTDGLTTGAQDERTNVIRLSPVFFFTTRDGVVDASAFFGIDFRTAS